MAAELVYGYDEDVGEWVRRRLPYELTFVPGYAAIGLERPGRGLVAGAVFDRFTAATCFMTLASNGDRDWCTPGYARAVFAYAFVQCGLRRLSAFIAASNQSSLRAARKMGFDEPEVIMRRALPDDDLVVVGMIREKCRWIPREFRFDPASCGTRRG